VTVSQLDSMRASSMFNPEVSPEPVVAGGTSLVVLRVGRPSIRVDSSRGEKRERKEGRKVS